MAALAPVQAASMDAAGSTSPQAPLKQPLKLPPTTAVRQILRHPTGGTNLTLDKWRQTMDRGTGEARTEPETPGWDMIRKKPCSPNDQYSCMNQDQILRLRNCSRPTPMFRPQRQPWVPDKRFYLERTATTTSQYLTRGQPGSHRWCWLDEPWRREPPELHDTSRLGASVPWGPEKMGSRTLSHFDGEDIYRYVHIDVYCRPPSNIVEPVVCKFGRAPSYYHQRKPNTQTWFGSSHELNRTDVLQGIEPKTRKAYDRHWTKERLTALQRRGQWPEFSEYTNRFLLKSTTLAVLSRPEQNKMHVAQGRTQQKEQD